MTVTAEREFRDVLIGLTGRGPALQAEVPALLDGIATRALREFTPAEGAQPAALLRRAAADLHTTPETPACP